MNYMKKILLFVSLFFLSVCNLHAAQLEIPIQVKQEVNKKIDNIFANQKLLTLTKVNNALQNNFLNKMKKNPTLLYSLDGQIIFFNIK